MSAIKKEDAFMTSQEMLERSSTWTLACDNALLNRLKKFSDELTKNSQEILKECDNLSRNVTQLDYRLINVSNEFLMLSNTQFVENRVEEFEEFSSSISSNVAASIPKTKAEKEAALISKMKKAIQLGLTACNDRRQRNETFISRYQMKQPYLIGSPKFFSSKYCGLVDESVRKVPIYQDIDMDSVSIEQHSDINVPAIQVKPEVKFTMPPTPVFPNKVLDNDRGNVAQDNHIVENGTNFNYGRIVVPPSPTISDRSSDVASSVSRDNAATSRSVTDQLNKIYGSFAPPAPCDDDSDDDFRPSAAVGRIFEDEDDDIFGEKELFPSSQKKTDFFGRSNPSHLPAPVFSVPPPMNPVSQSKTAVTNVQTLVGTQPKANDIPSMNRVAGDIPSMSPKNDVLIRGPPPEAEGPPRIKLPTGAVSMFGGLAPPVFKNGNLQAAPTANKDVPSLPTKPDNQISSRSSVESGSGLSSTFNRDNGVVSSHKHEDVNQEYVASQPSHNVAAPGRTENISQGSSSDFGVASSSKVKTAHVVPVSSLFAEDSSDEDIFLSSKKQDNLQRKGVIQSKGNPIVSTLPKTLVSNNASVASTSSKPAGKPQTKKSIFDDSESEDDLFSSRPSFSRSETNKKVAANSAKINDDLFKSDTKKGVAPIKVNTNKSLFGDDSDSDTDLFGNKKKVEVKSSSSRALTSSTKAPVKMEDVKTASVLDDDDLFNNTAEQEVPEQKSVKSNENNNNFEESFVNEKPVTQSSSCDSVSSKINAIAQEDSKPKLEKKEAVKKSIFDDSESDDDIFSSKTSSSIVATASKSESASSVVSVDQIRPLPTSSRDKDKRSSLFGDDSDSDSDLFSSKFKNLGSDTTEKEEEELTINKIVDSKEGNVKHNGENQQNLDEVDTASLPPLPKEEENESPRLCNESKLEDEPKSTKALGSKISEKIKAMQTTKTENNDASSDSTTKKNIKSKVSVKSLALNLKINPLALKVGAKPPKLSGSTPSTPDIDVSDASPVNNVSTPNSPEAISTEETKDNLKNLIEEKEKEYESVKPDEEQIKVTNAPLGKSVGVDELVGILKARVKIQKKRRPPSRSFLKSLAVPDGDEGTEEDNQNENANSEKSGDVGKKENEVENVDIEKLNHDAEADFE